jgi:hypothetical protein
LTIRENKNKWKKEEVFMGHHKEREVPSHADFKVGKSNQNQEPPEVADEELAGVRAQQERLIRRLQDLREASHDAWDELKSGAESAFEELRGSVHKVMERFESALKPEDRSPK